MKKAMFPGTFDPLHQGHKSIIKKASNLFDDFSVVVTYNNEKPSATEIEKRFEKVKSQLPGIKVLMNKNLSTAEFAKSHGINYIIRSARNDTDFIYELELAAGNNHMNQSLETVLIIPDYSNIEYHSRLIKQKVEE